MVMLLLLLLFLNPQPQLSATQNGSTPASDPASGSGSLGSGPLLESADHLAMSNKPRFISVNSLEDVQVGSISITGNGRWGGEGGAREEGSINEIELNASLKEKMKRKPLGKRLDSTGN